MLTILRTISASIPPVTVDLVKQHTRIDADADDNLVALYLLTSTQLVEGYLGRSLCNQKYLYTVAQTLPPNSWPWTAAFIPILPLGLSWTMFHLGHKPMELPRSPAVSVDLVSYGSWTAPDTVLAAGTDYYVDLTTDPGRLKLTGITSTLDHDHTSVTFTTGYAATRQTIEQPILHAIMMMTASFYENRGDVDAEVGITLTMKRLLSQYRQMYWA